MAFAIVLDSLSYSFASRQEPVDDFTRDKLFMLPWGHHIQIIGKCKGNTEKTVFYVKEAIQNNWSRGNFNHAQFKAVRNSQQC